MTKIELAYCAGVIDSDGTIGIKRNTYSVRVIGDSKAASYSERICVKQVEPHAVDLLKVLFGGSSYFAAAPTKGGRRLYVWQVTDLKATIALRAMLPYLRIKAEQARNCLDLRALKDGSRKSRNAVGRGHMGAAPRPMRFTVAMEALKIRAGELNRVGR